MRRLSKMLGMSLQTKKLLIKFSLCLSTFLNAQKEMKELQNGKLVTTFELSILFKLLISRIMRVG
jgi:hypothetical protein